MVFQAIRHVLLVGSSAEETPDSPCDIWSTLFATFTRFAKVAIDETLDLTADGNTPGYIPRVCLGRVRTLGYPGTKLGYNVEHTRVGTQGVFSRVRAVEYPSIKPGYTIGHTRVSTWVHTRVGTPSVLSGVRTL